MVLIAVFALVAAVIALIALFSVRRPRTFFGFNWGGVAGDHRQSGKARGCLIQNPTGSSLRDGPSLSLSSVDRSQCLASARTARSTDAARAARKECGCGWWGHLWRRCVLIDDFGALESTHRSDCFERPLAVATGGSITRLLDV